MIRTDSSAGSVSTGTAGASPVVTTAESAGLRAVMSRFASGVTVVTGLDSEGAPAGLTCQSFVSLSLAPPMVLFSAANSSTTLPRLMQASSIAINILGADQDNIATAFGRRSPHKFRGVAYACGTGGAPLLASAHAVVEGRIARTHPGGDHTIVLVDVADAWFSDDQGEPLVYYSSRFHRIAEHHAG